MRGSVKLTRRDIDQKWTNYSITSLNALSASKSPKRCFARFIDMQIVQLLNGWKDWPKGVCRDRSFVQFIAAETIKRHRLELDNLG